MISFSASEDIEGERRKRDLCDETTEGSIFSYLREIPEFRALLSNQPCCIPNTEQKPLNLGLRDAKAEDIVSFTEVTEDLQRHLHESAVSQIGDSRKTGSCWTHRQIYKFADRA